MTIRARVQKLDSDVVPISYPLADLLPGWFFRVREQSPGHYIAEGTDLWGRIVSFSGGDEALGRAVEAAQGIESQIPSA